MANQTRRIGLSLGADICWPICFEEIVKDLGPSLGLGEDKVQIALGIDRLDASGRVYRPFDTLWIATLVDGHWGIQFRSSYL